MQELAGRTVDLRLVAGRAADELAERLHHAAGWRARFALLDAFIRARLAAAAPPPPAIAWARQQLVPSGGRVRILRFARARRAILGGAVAGDWAGLALDCGYADQAHLIREFQALAGTTPRTYARLDHLPVKNFQDGA